jgi:hypothetical protein
LSASAPEILWLWWIVSIRSSRLSEVSRDSVFRDEFVPRLPPFAGDLRGHARQNFEPVLLSIVNDLFPAEDLREPDDLLRVVHVREEGDAPERQRRERAAEAPDVEGRVALHEVEEQLRPFVLPRRDPDVTGSRNIAGLAGWIFKLTILLDIEIHYV